MGFTRIWKEPRSKLTWRHGVLFLYWVITVIPMLLLVGAGWLAEKADELYGIPRQWANHDAYYHFTKPDLDYMNADRESITRPYPPTEVVEDAIVGIEDNRRN